MVEEVNCVKHLFGESIFARELSTITRARRSLHCTDRRFFVIFSTFVKYNQFTHTAVSRRADLPRALIDPIGHRRRRLARLAGTSFSFLRLFSAREGEWMLFIGRSVVIALDIGHFCKIFSCSCSFSFLRSCFDVFVDVEMMKEKELF